MAAVPWPTGLEQHGMRASWNPNRWANRTLAGTFGPPRIDQITEQFLYSYAEMQDWTFWFFNVLGGAGRRFVKQVWDDRQWVTVECEFVGPYQAQDQGAQTQLTVTYLAYMG